MDIVIVVAWYFALCLAVFVVGSQINVWLWCWQGNRLSRQFDALVRERQEVIDPIVLDPDIDNDEKRAYVVDILERFEEHAQRRAHWSRCAP